MSFSVSFTTPNPIPVPKARLPVAFPEREGSSVRLLKRYRRSANLRMKNKFLLRTTTNNKQLDGGFTPPHNEVYSLRKNFSRKMHLRFLKLTPTCSKTLKNYFSNKQTA